MTDRLYHIIEEIRTKMLNLSKQLNDERLKYISLKEENVRLEEELAAAKEQERVLTALNTQLKSEVVSAKSQVVEVPVSLVKKDEEIDELVNEIEYCISQLKK
jgi:glutamate-1-semialdehyde aminotransferase